MLRTIFPPIVCPIADHVGTALPDFQGLIIRSAEVVFGHGGGELVLLIGDAWHATISRLHNEQLQPYLSVAMFHGSRERAARSYEKVDHIAELANTCLARAVSMKVAGSAAIALDHLDGARTLFIAGSAPYTIDVAFENATASDSSGVLRESVLIPRSPVASLASLNSLHPHV